mmetsp:Transcript_109426/g.172513  ORF Transcript_109426/g.172513 Transcript_109426/m.172513 type:complete len:224 (+) Transcript_109426:518-1189(+)
MDVIFRHLHEVLQFLCFGSLIKHLCELFFELRRAHNRIFVASHTILCRPVLNCAERLGNNDTQSNVWHLSFFGQEDEVCKSASVLVRFLDFFNWYVFTERYLEHVLATINDLQTTIFCPSTNIACLKPRPVILHEEIFLRLLRHAIGCSWLEAIYSRVVVSFTHAWSSDPNFATTLGLAILKRAVSFATFFILRGWGTEVIHVWHIDQPDSCNAKRWANVSHG